MLAETNDYTQEALDYRRVEEAIQFLQQNQARQPSLSELAEHLHLSEYHLQRIFTRWVGISPKRFLQYLTKEQARRQLDRPASVMEAAYAAGLSGPGRLHDLFVACEAVTPGEYKQRGRGVDLRYGFHPSPFGECLLAATERGVSDLLFVDEDERGRALQALRARWPQAELHEDQDATAPLVAQLFAIFTGRAEKPLAIFLQGTNFQIKVWEALLRIPSGSVVTYGDLAVTIGLPKASRAVGNAVGRNPLPVLIPCHRVLPKSGALGGYRWGRSRKQALLACEMARREGGLR